MSRPQDIDFNAFARDFALRALADPAAAIADWRTATAGMTADLRSALGRTVALHPPRRQRQRRRRQHVVGGLPDHPGQRLR
jgi:hypothetical protein